MASKKQLIYDAEVVCPDFFEVPLDAGKDEAQQWIERAAAFVESMHAVKRAVLLKHDEEAKVLYLSSIEAES